MLDHVSCTVKNLEKSYDFYSSVFGLKIVREWKRENEGLSAKLLGSDSGPLIELVESRNPLMFRGTPGDFHEIGMRHIGFSVENLEQAIDKVIEYGGKLVNGPNKGITVKRWAFVADPDGITIELMEL